MGWFGSKKKRSTTVKNTWVEVDKSGYFYHYLNSLMNSGHVAKFDPKRGFMFASNLAEIFIPLDIIADRVASCRYVLYNKNTDEPVENVPERLLTLMNSPNPFHSGNQLVYQIQFSELCSGGSYTLSKMPSSFKAKSYDRISNIWCLNPDNTYPSVKNAIPDPFLIKGMDELVDYYFTHFMIDQKLDPSEVYYNTVTKLDDGLCPTSPLNSVHRNINNLLAVYSARFNVYEKNGKAGIVYKDAVKANDLGEQVNPVTRQQVLDDIQNKDGITGERNFTGISSYPLGFLETLGKIKDLEPFKETFADTIAIGANFGIDKELLPKDQSTTFTNKKDVEKHLWRNTIIPNGEEMAKTLTKVYYLPEEWEFRCKTDHIEVLQADRKTSAEADKIELENAEKLQGFGIEPTKILDKWKM